jgi:hypothetical protein
VFCTFSVSKRFVDRCLVPFLNVRCTKYFAKRVNREKYLNISRSLCINLNVL